MLDSNPAKAINFIASLLSIGSAIGGVFVGIQWKSDD